MPTPWPRAKIEGAPWDFSFSGLKTAVLNTANRAAQRGEPLDRAGLSASFCRAVADELAPRAIDAAVRCGHGIFGRRRRRSPQIHFFAVH